MTSEACLAPVPAGTRAWSWNAPILAVAFGLALLSYLLIGDLYLNLRDEGYLWYGVQAVGRGELPIRDFQSYDPARYYWCQLASLIVGEHVMGMRAGLAAFQALGLAFGLACVRRLVGSWVWLLPAGLLLLLWMFPRFKVFEASIGLLGVWSLTRLIELPEVKRFALAGVCLGLAACFGRNHGLYLGSASLGLFAYLGWKSRAQLSARALGAWALGVFVGYLPLLALLALAPGFGAAFLRELLATADRGANLPLDFAWPWKFQTGGLQGAELLQAWVEQLAFGLPLLALPLGVLALLRLRGEQLRAHATLVAAVLVSLPYAHHYGVRSDLPHLAQAALPLLLILLALARFTWRSKPWPMGLVLALLLVHASGLALLSHPTLKHFQPGVERPELAAFDAGGCELRLKAVQARHLERLQAMLAKYVPSEEPMFIAPTRSTFYPLFRKVSPVWWIYFLFQSTEPEQHELIARLERERVRWALIDEMSFSKDESFDFESTNPLVWEHLRRDWELVRDPIVPPGYYLFRRR